MEDQKIRSLEDQKIRKKTNLLTFLCSHLLPAAVIFCVSVVQAFAAPYLVCDPYPDESKPTRFELVVDGQARETPYMLHASGAAIILDLAGLSDGLHQITAIRACNERGCSSEVPLFLVPGIPGSLNTIRIAP